MGRDGGKGSVEVFDSVHEVMNENLSDFVEGVGEVGTSREMGKDSINLGSNKELKEECEEVKDQEKCDEENICDVLHEVDQGTSYSSSSLVNEEVVETVVVIESVLSEYINGEDRKLEEKVDESGGLSLVSMKEPKGVSETDNDSCVIDMKCSSHKGFYENSQGERICRICQLTSVQASDATTVGNASDTSGDFIQLGCACKDELGIAHVHCAEMWFKLKGNRYMFWPNFSLILIYIDQR